MERLRAPVLIMIGIAIRLFLAQPIGAVSLSDSNSQFQLEADEHLRYALDANQVKSLMNDWKLGTKLALVLAPTVPASEYTKIEEMVVAAGGAVRIYNPRVGDEQSPLSSIHDLELIGNTKHGQEVLVEISDGLEKEQSEERKMVCGLRNFHVISDSKYPNKENPSFIARPFLFLKDTFLFLMNALVYIICLPFLLAIWVKIGAPVSLIRNLLQFPMEAFLFVKERSTMDCDEGSDVPLTSNVNNYSSPGSCPVCYRWKSICVRKLRG